MSDTLRVEPRVRPFEAKTSELRPFARFVVIPTIQETRAATSNRETSILTPAPTPEQNPDDPPQKSSSHRGEGNAHSLRRRP